MPDKEIEITIKKDGTVEMDLQGFNGKGCSEAAAEFIKQLGKTSKSKKKAEWHQTEKAKVCNKNHI